MKFLSSLIFLGFVFFGNLSSYKYKDSDKESYKILNYILNLEVSLYLLIVLPVLIFLSSTDPTLIKYPWLLYIVGFLTVLSIIYNIYKILSDKNNRSISREILNISTIAGVILAISIFILTISLII